MMSVTSMTPTVPLSNAGRHKWNAKGRTVGSNQCALARPQRKRCRCPYARPWPRDCLACGNFDGIGRAGIAHDHEPVVGERYGRCQGERKRAAGRVGVDDLAAIRRDDGVVTSL